MTEFAWFKLLLRAIGILLCGLSLPTISTQIGYIAQALGSGTPFPMEYIWMYLGGLIGAAAQAGIGLYLLFGGGWIINRCLREVRNRCVSCGYDLTAATGDMCPECGAPILRPPGSSAPAAKPAAQPEPPQ